MAINIEVNSKQLSEELELHYLPAGIDGDGQANVNEYFNNYTIKENNHLTNALRGFPLDGIEFKVPKPLVGVVFQENNRGLDESADRLLRVSGIFNKFTYWNYDRIPSAEDGLQQAMQVLCVGEELSRPVLSEEIEKEMDLNNKKEETNGKN